MKELESADKPHSLDAAELINLMAHAGPGTSLSVRIRSKKNGHEVGIGRTKYNDDRCGGPAVAFPNPENSKEEWLIPLGGQTVYDSPPRVNSLMEPLPGTPFGEVTAHQKPIDSIAEGYTFEMIQKKKNSAE